MEKTRIKKFKIILASVLMTLSVVGSCLSASALSDQNATEEFETGCLCDSDKTVEDHLASDKEIYDLEDVNLADPALEDAMVSYLAAEVSDTLPETVDMTNQFPTPKTQGGVGSCVGWATAYALKSHQEYVEHGWAFSDKTTYSPSYVYNQINSGRDNGSNISTALQLIVDQGVCPMYNMQYADYKRNAYGNLVYEDGKLVGTPYLIKPNDTQKDIASNYKASDYNILYGVEKVKKSLAEGEAVVIRIEVYPDFDNVNRNNDTYDVINDGETSRGGHAVCLVGYYDENQRFKLMNSWGANWGLNGFAYISYDIFESTKCSRGYGYTLTDRTHDDDNEFFTEAPDYVVAATDVRAYTAPDYFVSNIDLENYVDIGTDNYHHIIPAGSYIGIDRFVPASNGVQPYFVTEDGYYISANKDTLSLDTGVDMFISGRNRFSYNYLACSEKSSMYVYHDTSERFSGHGSMRIRYTMYPEDSNGGYDGAKVYGDKTVSTEGASEIGFWYMTPSGNNGTIAFCLQGSVEKKLVELPTTNGEWVYYQNTYNFTTSELSDIEIYINGNENNIVTNPTSGYLYIAEFGVVKDTAPQKCSFRAVAGSGYVTGSANKEYYKNAYITVTATPKYPDKQTFIGWSKTKGGEIISTESTYTFMLTEDTTLYANYESTICAVDIVKTTGCAGYAIDNDSDFTEPKEFNKNATCVISATGESGYNFEGWYTNPEFNGTPVATTEEAVITITSDMTLYPKYVKEAAESSTPDSSIADSSSDADSSTPDSSSDADSSSDDDTEVMIGSLSFGETWNWTKHLFGSMDFSNYKNVRFELVAEKGEFNKVYVNGTEKYIGKKTSFSANLDGSDFENVAGKSNVTFETEGNGQQRVTFYGVRTGSNNDDSSVPDSSSQEDSSIPDDSSEPDPVPTQYTIIASSNGNGTAKVNDQSSVTVDENTDVTLTAVADSGYEFEKWDDGNTNATRTVTVVADKTYTATFKKIQDEPDNIQVVNTTPYTFDYYKYGETTGTVRYGTPDDVYVQFEGVSFNGEYTYTFSAAEMSTNKAILQGNPYSWSWITSFEVWGISK